MKFINIIKETTEKDNVCKVKTNKRNVLMRRQRSSLSVPCRGYGGFVPNSMFTMFAPAVDPIMLYLTELILNGLTHLVTDINQNSCATSMYSAIILTMYLWSC